MRRLLSIFPLAALVVSLLFTDGCRRDEPGVCEEFCEGERDCYQTLDQPFSVSACERDCRDEKEANALIGCKGAYIDLLDCQTDIPCTASSELGRKCGTELDRLSDCRAE